MKQLLPLTAVVFVLSVTAAAVNVTVTSPGNNQQVGSPFTLSAHASSNNTITAWNVYLDGSNVYHAGRTTSISASINASTGTHQLVTRAWDSSGAYGTVTETITVSSGGGGGGGGSGVTVSVSSPSNGGQVGSPFNLVANASSQYTITGWAAYLDGHQVYSGGRTNNINTQVSGGNGSHQLVVRAWNSNGSYGDVTENISISGGGGGGGGNGLPTPPGDAIWFNNIQNRGNWQWCHDPGCAGGSGRGSYWMAQHQRSPSRSGSSAEFFNSGVWANALWWQKVGANNSKRNFLWDFWIYLDGNSHNAAQALEFDAFQFVGGYNYMMGTQCNYAAGKWDTYDEAAGHWVHSSAPCPRFTTSAWHHIQWYMTTNPGNHSYTFHTLVVDGHSYTLNVTGHARNLHWGDNVGVQYQLDVNSSGTGYHEWVDNVSLAIW